MIKVSPSSHDAAPSVHLEVKYNQLIRQVVCAIDQCDSINAGQFVTLSACILKPIDPGYHTWKSILDHETWAQYILEHEKFFLI